MKQVIIVLAVLFTSFAATAQTYKSTTVLSPEDKLNDMYCSGMFQSTHGTILEVAGAPGISSYLNILNWMQGRVAGLQIYTEWVGQSLPVIRGGVPGIL